MSSKQKWFTCTPVRFKGDQTFFSRESGMLCKGFQEIGVECKAIMPGPAMDDDLIDDLIRTEYRNLEDPAWWKSLGGNGVVFYGWGLSKYTRIARAIKVSGMVLITNMDTSGLISPYVAGADYTKLILAKYISRLGFLRGSLLGTVALCKSLIPAFFDKQRFLHLMCADYIAVVTPQAVEIVKRLACRFELPAVAAKVIYCPHPQSRYFSYDGCLKDNTIVTVGRWGKEAWHQKNPQLLLKSIALFLQSRRDYRSLIVGGSVEQLMPLVIKHCSDVTDRISLVSLLTPVELSSIYRNAKIGFWTSRNEGQQGTGAQALCCGCSVVATTGITMNCFAHYCSRSSGRQAIRNEPFFLSDALIMEAQAWDDGHRNPILISENWVDEFHSSSIARKLLNLASN